MLLALLMNPYNFSKFLIEAEKLKKEGISDREVVKLLAKKYKVKESSLRSRWWRHVKNAEKQRKRPHIAARLKNVRKNRKLILSTEAGLCIYRVWPPEL